MLETNIRLFKYGPNLFLDVRRVKVEALQVSAKQLESACGTLRQRHRLAAVRDTVGGGDHLLVASRDPVRVEKLEVGGWPLTLTDTGSQRLQATDSRQANALAHLLERALLMYLDRRTDLWSLGSPRQWYGSQPFATKAGIAAYRGYRVSVIPIEGAGVGAVAHLNTAFFTADPVAYFFDETVPQAEQQRRQALFERYGARQAEQTASLLYQAARRPMTCALEKFLAGKTCGNTPSPKINNQTYDSVYDYYRQNSPDLNVQADDSVALVSFPWSNDVVPVAAKLLYARVMNDAVPPALSQVDKLKPHERRWETQRFWQTVGTRFLGRGLEDYFWQPPAEKVQTITFPMLRFGKNQLLSPPAQTNAHAYGNHFRTRFGYLKTSGCYYVPPTIDRKIIIAHSQGLPSASLDDFEAAVTERLQSWVGKTFSVEKLAYTDVKAVIDTLNKRSEGFVIFILDGSVDAYYLLSAKLKSLRVKRVTAAELRDQHAAARGRWHSFVDLTMLDVVEQLGCVPWGVAPDDLHYNAYLGIDVGEKRRHFALALLAHNQRLPYWLGGDAYHKPRADQEAISSTILSDKISEIGQMVPAQMRPLASILILRDGRQSGEEGQAIQTATQELIDHGVFAPDVRVDVVDFAKSSLREIRHWEQTAKNRQFNALEGTALHLDQNTVVLTTTGQATLRQGTANPLVLTATQDGVDMKAVAEDVFALAQLNWANPKVGQRLPHIIRVVDNILEAKMAEETRGLA